MSNILAGDASKILGISKRTLYRWEKEGRIRSVRDGVLNVRVYDNIYIEMIRSSPQEHILKMEMVCKDG